MVVIAALRSRLEALNPAIPLVVDVFLVLFYTLITVLWVESVQTTARPSPLSPAP
jgi:hypothetical protein